MDRNVLSRLSGAAGGRWLGSWGPGLRGTAAGALAVILAGCGNEPPPQNSYVALPKPMLTADVQPRRIVAENAPQDQPLAKSTPKETAAVLARLGRKSADEGNPEGAVQFYRRSLALDPGSIGVTLALADLLYRLGDHRAALETYRQALRLDPVNDEAMRGTGKTLVALDRPQEAVDQYRQAMVRLPNDARVLNGLGVALDMTGDHRAAQQQYRLAMLQSASEPSVQNNMALSLALSGDYQQSVEMLTRLVNSPVATARNRQNLALVYGLMGLELRAAEIARQDLSDEQVRRNLSYYAQLRALNDQQRSAAVFSTTTSRRGEHNPAPGLTPSTTPQLPAPEPGMAPPPRVSTVPDAELPAIGPAAGAPAAAPQGQPAAPVKDDAPDGAKGATGTLPSWLLPVPRPSAVQPPATIQQPPAAKQTGELAPAKPPETPAEKPAVAAATKWTADNPPPARQAQASIEKQPGSFRSFLEALLAAPPTQDAMPRNRAMTTTPEGAPAVEEPSLAPFSDTAK
ncbi:MAG: tetratricopeptide repeat protein [Alphaproteobacteria bacterium]|nr:tetratricopeptide repeat protein [Alphaproteobacteria bacterium]